MCMNKLHRDIPLVGACQPRSYQGKDNQINLSLFEESE